jgi:hypothetical protein
MMTALSARDVEEIVEPPSAAIERLAETVMRVVTAQWQRCVDDVFESGSEARRAVSTPKARRAAIMYARGCYSMVVLGRRAPLRLRALVRVSGHLPLSANVAARMGSLTFGALSFLLPKRVHRRIVLVGVLMVMLDEIVDDYAQKGRATERVFEDAVMRVLVRALREGESEWQRDYWNSVMLPAMTRFVREEQRAVAGQMDVERMGYRGAGIDAGIKSMWYAVGTYIGLGNPTDSSDRANWNLAQRWMAEGALLVQMMDDWVDRDKDALVRPTPVTLGQWTMKDIEAKYRATGDELAGVLREQGIDSHALQSVVRALYAEYLYRALRAMHDARD